MDAEAFRRRATRLQVMVADADAASERAGKAATLLKLSQDAFEALAARAAEVATWAGARGRWRKAVHLVIMRAAVEKTRARLQVLGIR